MNIKNKTLAIVVLILTSFLVFADVTKSTHPVTETRELAAFDRVELNIPAQVDIVSGTQQLQISGDAQAIATIITEVADSTLKVTTKKSIRSLSPVEITISLPDIKGIAIHGSGNMTVAKVNNENFSASISGSGEITAQGTTLNAQLEIAGSGAIKAEKLAIKNASASIAGSGDIHIGAVETLTSNIAGSGRVSYSGTPKVESQVAGSGAVVARR